MNNTMITGVKMQSDSTTFKQNEFIRFEDMYPELVSMISPKQHEQQSFWADEQNNDVPNTPVTPSMLMNNAPSGKPTIPEQDPLHQYLSPDELLLADDIALFDDQSVPQVSNWEPLFLNDSISCPEDQQSYSAIDVSNSTTTSNLEQQRPQNVFSEPQSKETPNLMYTPSPSTYNSTVSPAMQSDIGSPYGSSPAMSSISSPGMSKAPTKSSLNKEVKLDDLGITVYKRKPRANPLKPVEVPADATGVIAKRAKNTEAARRSRARKLERMSQLEQRVRSLLDENEALRAEIAQLKGNQSL